MFGPIRLNFRSLLLIKGKGSKQFLQGLVTKDLESLDRAKLIYTFLLNVKGRILADMLIWRKIDSEETYLLETDSTQMDALQKALKLYRLRKPIEIEPMPETNIYFCLDPNFSANNWQADPRVPGFGFRSINECKIEEKRDDEQMQLAYLRHRFDWGIAEGSEMNQQIPLNMNGDLMNGISFEKGCYIGQELVARTFHLGVIRRRLMPFRWIDPKTAPAKLCPTELAEEKESKVNDLILRDEKGKRQGKLISSYGESGLCLASVQAIPSNTTIKLFDGKGRVVEVRRPKWWPKIDQQGNPKTTEIN